MKIFLALMLFVSQAFAITPYTKDIDLSVNNLAATYNTSFPQLAISGMVYTQHFMMINTSAGAVCCNTVTQSTVAAPTALDGHEMCIPATSFFSWDNINVHDNIYCRSKTGVLAAGILTVQAW